MLNVISPLLPSCWGFSFALGRGVSFGGGIQHSPVCGCSVVSCSFSQFLLLHHQNDSNYRTIALISHTSKVMLKTLQVRLQQYMNRKLPDVQAGFRKGRGIRDQIASIRWVIEKNKRIPEKHLLLLHELR